LQAAEFLLGGESLAGTAARPKPIRRSPATAPERAAGLNLVKSL
jgi:hypothetical protein